jgi:hypothetical protein
MIPAFKATLALSLLIWAMPSFAAPAPPPSQVETKAELLKELQDLRAKNVKRLTEIDAALVKKLESSEMTNLVSAVDTLQSEKHEHLLRQEFLDRLIFQVDTKYTTGTPRDFVEHALIDMAKVDAGSAATVDNGEGLWKFLKFASDAIHRLPEKKENVVAFIEGYMSHSIANPILPEAYLATRNYSNGAVSEQGRPASREVVGAFADRRLQQIGLQPASPPVSQQTR